MRHLRVGAGLALMTFVPFLPTLFNGFISSYDDGQNFLSNVYLRGLGPIHQRWAWTTTLSGAYQPLAWMLFEVEYSIWGLEPLGYHLISIFIHCPNVTAIFFLAIAILTRVSAGSQEWNVASAALATAVFAVHPLRVEAVAWASRQPYLPCVFFAVLAMLIYLHAQTTGRLRQVARLVAA
jgi:hypothetical protein